MSPERNRILSAVSASEAAVLHVRRRLVLRVLDLTSEVVACAARCEWQPVVRLLAERRKLLGQLAEPAPGRHPWPCLPALQAAMAESDRTVEMLLSGNC